MNFWENHGLTCKKCDFGGLEMFIAKKGFFFYLEYY